MNKSIIEYAMYSYPELREQVEEGYGSLPEISIVEDTDQTTTTTTTTTIPEEIIIVETTTTTTTTTTLEE